MIRILGYADRISAAPGECIQVKVSCEGLDQYDADLVRVIHGDINPSGPGYRDAPVPLDLGGPFKGRYQPIHAGSFGVVNAKPLFPAKSSLGLQAFVFQTLPGRGPQTILSRQDPQSGIGFRLYLDPEGAAALEVTAGGEKGGVVATGAPLIAERWYLISGSYDAASGALTVAQKPLKSYPWVNDADRASRTVPVNLAFADVGAPVMIAARQATDRPAT